MHPLEALPPGPSSSAGRAPTPTTHASSLGSARIDLANAIVRLLRQSAGRGPGDARATITDDLAIVTLRDCLTKVEQTLVAGGEGGLVTEARSALHRGMRDEAIAQAEAITGRRVAAFMTDQQYDPDISVIVFVFAPEDDCKQGRTARRG